jgi:hypothetical protein
MDSSRSGRSAITLTEMVVVIAIVVIVGGLAVSAIQSANNASNQAKCTNNVKQLGLAVHNFHSTFDALPALTADQTRPIQSTACNSSLFFELLPYMEHNFIFGSALASLPNCTWYGASEWDMPPPFSTVTLGIENVPLCSRRFGSYQCPADSTIINYLSANQAQSRTDSPPYFFAWAAGSYAANYQVFGIENNLGSLSSGNYCGPKYRAMDIPDGVGNTVFFGEQFAACGDSAGSLWAYPGIGNYSGTQYASAATGTPPPRGVGDSIVNRPDETNSKLWAPVFANSHATYGFTAGGRDGSIFEYNQQARMPLQAPYEAGAYWDAPPQSNIGRYECDKSRLQSFHRNGSVVGMGNGSVRFIFASVSQATWHAAVVPDDGQALGSDW